MATQHGKPHVPSSRHGRGGSVSSGASGSHAVGPSSNIVQFFERLLGEGNSFLDVKQRAVGRFGAAMYASYKMRILEVVQAHIPERLGVTAMRDATSVKYLEQQILTAQRNKQAAAPAANAARPAVPQADDDGDDSDGELRGNQSSGEEDVESLGLQADLALH